MNITEKLGLWLMAIGTNLYLRGGSERRTEKAQRFMDAYNGELLECAVLYAGGHGFSDNQMKSAQWSADVILGMLRSSDVKLDTDRPLSAFEQDAKFDKETSQ